MHKQFGRLRLKKTPNRAVQCFPSHRLWKKVTPFHARGVLGKIVSGNKDRPHFWQMRLNGLSKRESVNWFDRDITDEHIDAPVPVDPLDRFVARGGYPECAPAILLKPSGETGGKTGLVIDNQYIHSPPSLRYSWSGKSFARLAGSARKSCNSLL